MELLKIKERQHQEDLQRLRGLRPIDDDFMRCLFKDNIPLVELVLRIITGKPDLVITGCETQKDMKRLAGARSICLDAYGTDSSGKRYDLEIQRQDKGAGPHRARYHSSVMDIENLHSGQEFEELPDTYTIFIIEKDFYGKGEPVYPIERINLATGKFFEDGEHILYVNGEYRGESDLGKLMHDFNCTSAENMNFKLIADRTRYLKENPKGVQEMCKVMEDMRNESLEQGMKAGRKESMKATALRMLSAGKYALDEIASISGLSIEEVKELKTEENV
ncbi:MAG: PD-(D/E)XK nuclease family transposase [Clostridium sp.]|nr:PD-(D/E)XK nuclease family transposase [Clostridium sp.]